MFYKANREGLGEKFMSTRVFKQSGMSKKNRFLKRLKKDYPLWLFVLPGIIITFIFSYVPLYGVQIAFRNFNPKLGFFGSPWVGLEHFKRFFDSPYFFTTIKNTFVLSLYSLIAGFPIPILLALILNSFRHKKYRKVIQTVTYAPNFISTVVMCGMLLLFLSPSVGIINNVIEFFGGNNINFMAEKDYWRHIYVWSGVWQGMGWSSVIYFAALSSVSPELHEAAIVDGATKFQIVRYIDFPSIIPTATILLILSCGSILSVGFEKVFLLQNDLNLSVSQVISTYVYKVGLIDNNISYSSAIGLFNSAVNAILLIVVNRISKKLSGISLW
ncbi:sugar ABC transporter permease [Vallitalea longa]|uniref:Sugar ABC transporter permease n=2 Tax=Vallitalea longa TaxID=2936439 RepID=A0A9W6DEL5_9FIRM|nr:sugar ABC transporter permease [Vallitalea longa]